MALVFFSFSVTSLAIAVVENKFKHPKVMYKKKTVTKAAKQEDVISYGKGKFSLKNLNAFSTDRELDWGDGDGDGDGVEPPSLPPDKNFKYYIENPGECALHNKLKLAGTMPAIPDEFSSATFTTGRGKKAETKVISVGESVDDSTTLLAVRRNLVVFKTSSGIKCLGDKVGKKSKDTKSATSYKPPFIPGPGKGDDSTIKKTSENSYSINRSELNKLTSDFAGLARQARIVPVKGEDGFKIYSIKRNSLYKKIGIKNGDIIKSINGIPLTSPDKAMEAYSRLRNANNISLELKRRGQRKSIDYSIEDK